MPSNDASAAIASALQKKLPGLNSPPKPRLAPMQKPKGIDPIEMLREREYRYNQLSSPACLRQVHTFPLFQVVNLQSGKALCVCIWDFILCYEHTYIHIHTWFL